MAALTALRIPLSFIRKDIISGIYARSCSSKSFQEPSSDHRLTRKGIKKRHPVETCLKYMDSEAYQTTYGDKPVWLTYVRNFKGSRAPKTRENCVYRGIIFTGSPCPICRDEYLLADYRNIKLLKQFISPYGGEILDTSKTGVCQTQQRNLKVAIKKAQNYGYLTFSVPHRHYNYNFYKKKLNC